MAMKDPSGTPPHRRSLKPLAWAALPVISLAVGVLASGSGFDLLLLATAGLLLLTLERTVGDWMGELLGAGPASIAFALGVAGLGYYFLGHSSGQARTNQLLASAEQRGYRSSYYRPASAPVVSSGAMNHSSSGAAVSGNAHAPRAAEGTGGSGNSGGNGGAGGGGGSDAAPASASRPEADKEKVLRASAPATAVAPAQPRPAGTSGASRIVFGPSASVAAPVPTTITLIVSPSEATVGYRASFQALITAAGVPVTEGTVDFTVDSSGAGRVALDRRGMAASSFVTHIAGTYDVRARFLGTAKYESSTISRILTVRSR
jgi:hypothetical protein